MIVVNRAALRLERLPAQGAHTALEGQQLLILPFG
jgi:hypothetical protein